jgi:hypothetical protein
MLTFVTERTYRHYKKVIKSNQATVKLQPKKITNHIENKGYRDSEIGDAVDVESGIVSRG